MALANLSSTEDFHRLHTASENNFETQYLNETAISWAAILAGATAAAVLSLILLLLGVGLGLSSVSHWAHKGVSAATFGVSTIVWIIVTQIMASGMGGYLAGRLRVRWADVHGDEVYFRDTAHGFLAWAVATLVTAVMFASAVGAIVGGGVQAAATVTGGAAATVVTAGIPAAGSEIANNSTGVKGNDAMSYLIESLFRKNTIDVSATSLERNMQTENKAQNNDSTSEVSRIFLNTVRMESLPADDLAYMSQLVSKHTGITKVEAEKRVMGMYINMQTQIRNAELAAKNTTESARKASVYTTLWLFVSLLIGAFSASLAATWGGRCRDA